MPSRGQSGCNDPANELLPWYLNGSLEPDDAARVGNHLDDCAVCSRELEVLSAVAREVGEHDVAILDPSESDGPAARDERSHRRVWAVAAGLAIPLALGAWALSRILPGSPGEHPHPAALAQAVAWDLQAPRRGDTSGTAFLPPPPEAAVVTLRVPAPVDADAMFDAELHCPGGRHLALHTGRLVLDPLGWAAFALPAYELRKEGSYEFILRKIAPDGVAMREFPFPFRVAPATPE